MVLQAKIITDPDASEEHRTTLSSWTGEALYREVQTALESADCTKITSQSLEALRDILEGLVELHRQSEISLRLGLYRPRIHREMRLRAQDARVKAAERQYYPLAHGRVPLYASRPPGLYTSSATIWIAICSWTGGSGTGPCELLGRGRTCQSRDDLVPRQRSCRYLYLASRRLCVLGTSIGTLPWAGAENSGLCRPLGRRPTSRSRADLSVRCSSQLLCRSGLRVAITFAAGTPPGAAGAQPWHCQSLRSRRHPSRADLVLCSFLQQASRVGHPPHQSPTVSTSIRTGRAKGRRFEESRIRSRHCGPDNFSPYPPRAYLKPERAVWRFSTHSRSRCFSVSVRAGNASMAPSPRRSGWLRAYSLRPYRAVR
ncbi:hypothetical protein OH77DRAFT_1023074 [Trametes cingulata]|nr:hypothetical protein OH77DRAFT_1023074 [Trametes cingulata]